MTLYRATTWPASQPTQAVAYRRCDLVHPPLAAMIPLPSLLSGAVFLIFTFLIANAVAACLARRRAERIAAKSQTLAQLPAGAPIPVTIVTGKALHTCEGQGREWGERLRACLSPL